MHVKPKPGLVVRDPVTRQPLPADGAEVQPSPFWARRLADGDVVQVVPIHDSQSAPSAKAVAK